MCVFGVPGEKKERMRQKTCFTNNGQKFLNLTKYINPQIAKPNKHQVINAK